MQDIQDDQAVTAHQTVIGQLPSFVDLNVVPANLFTAVPIGDQATDHQRGRLFAEEAMAFTRAQHNPMLIYLALAAIASHDVITDVDLGFLDRIASAASAGSMN